MMRLMGAVLVAFGAAWLGLTAAAELGRKVRRLEQLSIGLELLERELWERGSPLPQVLEELSLRTGEPASTLFAQCAAACGRLDREPFPDAWRRLVTELEGLTPEGRAALLPLGAVALAEGTNARIIDASTAHRTAPGWVYGFPELKKGQREAIAQARSALERERERAEGEKLRMGRVYQALGLSGGAFLVILLL